MLADSRIPYLGPTPQEVVIMMAVFAGMLAIVFVVLQVFSNHSMALASRRTSLRVPIVALVGSLWIVWVLYVIFLAFGAVSLYMWYTHPAF